MRRVPLAFVVILTGACSNAQRAAFERCEALENQGDHEGALKACNDAVARDRTTKWGELASSKAYSIQSGIKSRLEAQFKDYEERRFKWEQDVKAGKIPHGTPPPEPSARPGVKCNCTPGDPLCSCL